MRLVAHVVKKFHPSHELLDDYISIGTIGLMKAVASLHQKKKHVSPHMQPDVLKMKF